MTREMVDEWSALYEDEIASPTETIQSREQMLSTCEDSIENMNHLADEIYADWISKLGK